MAQLFIFDKDESIQAVLSNDSPLACQFWDAKHTEKLDGSQTFEFKIDGKHWFAQYVVEEALVAFKDMDGGYCLFTIKELEEEHTDRIIKSCYCESAALELIDEMVKTVNIQNTDAKSALGQVLSGTRWEVDTYNVTVTSNQTLKLEYTNALDAVYQVADIYNGELKFRVQIAGSSITKRYIELHAKRGTDRGTRFEYTKDIASVTRKIDTTNIKTALYALGKSKQVRQSNKQKVEVRTNIKDADWNTSRGDPVTKPLNQDWVGDPVALAQFGRPGGASGKRHRFGFFEDGEEENAYKLLDKAWKALQKTNKPLVEYGLKALTLEKLTDTYGYTKVVRLGDTVRIVDKEFKPDLLIEARVIEITRYIGDDYAKTDIKVGNFTPTYTTNQARLSNVETVIAKKQGVWTDGGDIDTPIESSRLMGEIQAASSSINAGGGTVKVTESEGIIIYDNPASPTKALMLKNGMLSIANSKDIYGDWEWEAFGDGDGFTGKLIKAASLEFDKCKGGVLRLGGQNGENGRLELWDNEGKNIVGTFAADEDTGFSKLWVGEIDSPNIIKSTGAPRDYYINNTVTLPDGATPDGSINYPFQSIQACADALPKVLIYDATLYVTGTYYENVVFKGIVGSGTLNINLGTSTINGSLYFKSCGAYIKVYGQSNPNFAKINTVQYYPNGVGVSNCTLVELQYLRINAKNSGSTPSDLALGVNASRVSISDSVLENAGSDGMHSYFGSVVNIHRCMGSGNVRGLNSGDGCIVSVDGSYPMGNSSANHIVTSSTGQKWVDAGAVAAASPTGGTNPGTQTTVVYNCTFTKSWRTYYNSWRTDGDRLYQGQWEYGNHKGLMFWNGSDAWSPLVGRTIKSARLYIKRYNGGGSSSKQVIRFWGHDHTSQPGGEPTLKRDYGTLISLAWNEEAVINMPQQFLTDVSTGFVKGLGVHATSASPYVILCGDSSYQIKIEFTYQ